MKWKGLRRITAAVATAANAKKRNINYINIPLLDSQSLLLLPNTRILWENILRQQRSFPSVNFDSCEISLWQKGFPIDNCCGFFCGLLVGILVFVYSFGDGYLQLEWIIQITHWRNITYSESSVNFMKCIKSSRKGI